MRIAFIVSSVALLLICCKQKAKEDIFSGVPTDSTKKYIDSIAKKIFADAGMPFTGRPSPQKNTSYYDERNYRDSQGNLAEYLIIENLSDTIENYTSYYFYKNHLIQVWLTKIAYKKFLGLSRYYFRDDKIFDSDTGRLSLIPADTLLNRAKLYLSYKGDLGDTKYR
jgi:hypothetical protein